MGFWTAMVIIVTVSAIASVMRAKHGVIRTGRGKEEAFIGYRHDETEIVALRGELGQLKDRIAVLERIATENDRGVMLDREIEKLRSQPAR
jgi:hypothetical protein